MSVYPLVSFPGPHVTDIFENLLEPAKKRRFGRSMATNCRRLTPVDFRLVRDQSIVPG